jgi:hypothetical protein
MVMIGTRSGTVDEIARAVLDLRRFVLPTGV